MIDKIILFLDSLFNKVDSKNNSRFLKYIGYVCQYLKDRNNDDAAVQDYKNLPASFDGWSFECVECPQQRNGNDCGIFAIKFAECAIYEDDRSKLLFNFNHKNISMIRREICRKILFTTDGEYNSGMSFQPK